MTVRALGQDGDGRPMQAAMNAPRGGVKILTADQLERRVGVVVGTRPGIIMLSPVIRELARCGLDYFLVHTGQHYSYNMDQVFFDDLQLQEPAFKLNGIAHHTLHGEQTAEMLSGCEQVFLKARPRVVLVGGDANTNLAAALAARKLQIQVGHIEAGERSGDWRMPEEHNRVMIDHISDYLFVTNDKGKAALIMDRVHGKIIVTGNPIVDAAHQNAVLAEERSSIIEDLGLTGQEYFVLTLHREENVDSIENLQGVLEAMSTVARQYGRRIVFPVHPRTRKRLREFGLDEYAAGIEGLELGEAIGYLDFLKLMRYARLALTDSGGVQQEACILRVPCVTLRDNTEWTETVDTGMNLLCGTVPERIAEGVGRMLGVRREWAVPFGDGDSARRIVSVVEQELNRS